ncbi:MAG TPA: ATP-binding cassette domain-containing protein, partial [Casimicrobiaceae bacterium]|nr:ATP-binding cassette domain-containing protein [Casimicrobiaceae bacterium]
RYKNTKARQAQSKLKQIDRIKKEQVFASDHRKRVLGFEFLKPARSGRDVVVAEELEVRAGDKELLDGASFFVQRGEHVALVGPNGSGKTTLLETMLGRRDALAGTVRLGHGVEPAYFSQHEVELDERGSVLEAAMAGTGLKRPEAQKLLGQFLFSGWDEHEKPVVALSGGERRRLALAIVVASGANFLVLDEPTNHLDLESRESLERALEAFPGTVLLVSHDRALLDAVAERLLAVEDKHVASYSGGWADYVRAQEPQVVAPPPPPKEKPAKPKRVPKPAPSALELVEKEVARAEQRVGDLEKKLAEDWSDMALLAAHREAREDLQALLQRWESLMGA